MRLFAIGKCKVMPQFGYLKDKRYFCTLKCTSRIEDMIVISSAELRNNMKKYLDTASTEAVIIQRGKSDTFILFKQENFPDVSTEIPDDYYRAISGKEVISRIETGLRDIIQRKGKQIVTQ